MIVILLQTLLLSDANRPLLKTGQVKSYNGFGYVVNDNRDDGYYQKGVTRRYSQNGHIITDNVTKLRWQDNEIVTRPWLTQEAYDRGDYNAYAEGETAWAYCNKLIVDDITDWRLPSIKELETIMYTQAYNPAIDPIFQHIGSIAYWSFTEEYNFIQGAWAVQFENGITNVDIKTQYKGVRCVKGTELEEFNTHSSGNTLEDPLTKLQWQDNEIVETNILKWEDAINYCERLVLQNRKDWRLPNIIELQSISKRRTLLPYYGFNHHPPIFEGSYSLIWSSTSAISLSSARPEAWGVVGNYGSAESADKESNQYYVRCVRNNNDGNMGGIISPIYMILLN